MEGIILIEGQIFKSWDSRFTNMEQLILSLAKKLEEINPSTLQSSVPDFISIEDASKKYKISRVTINNKIKKFKELKKRDIDRLQSGNYFLINEAELQEAINIKGFYKG